MNVLVTDGEYKHTLGIVRSLGQKGIQVSVIASSTSALASSSRYCHQTEVVSNPSQPAYAESVLRILVQNSYDLLIPVGYSATESLAQRRKEILSLTKLDLVDHAQIRQAADKRYVSDLAASLDIPVPRAIYPEVWEEIARSVEGLRYPVVIKPLHESAGATTFHVQSPDELLPTYRQICSRSDCQNRCLMLQEYVPGYGCGFFALYEQGICKRIFMHRRVRENPPSGGASTCAESFYDSKLRDYGIRLLDQLKWHGVAMVEFRYDVRIGDYKLLEINPKFWGSLDLALAAGVDFPYYLCQMARGEKLEYSEEYVRDLRYHWPFSGEIQHLMQRPSSLGGFLADTFNPSVKSNIWMSDPRPNLREVFSLTRSAWRRIFNG